MVQALDEVGRISDAELVRGLERLVRADRALSAKLIVHLGEVEARELHRDRSYSTMFEYCRSGLGMSEGEAALRILAARVGRRFPLVVERLGAGAVNLTGIRLLAPHLTAENHAQLLDRVRGMSKRKIEVLLAELAPKPDVPERMRRLPEPRGERQTTSAAIALASCSAPTSESHNAPTNAASCSTLSLFAPEVSVPPSAAPSSSGTMLASQGSSGVASSASAPEPPVSQAVNTSSPALAVQPTAAKAAAAAQSTKLVQRPRRARARLTPLSPGRFDLQLTVGQETHDALEQLVELLRHQNPSGDFTMIVERALCELLKREMKRRFGHSDATERRDTREPAPAAKPDVDTKVESSVVDAETESPESRAKTKQEKGASKSRHIPQKVRREVHMRDNGQCTYVSSDGRRCTERGFLEIHHHNTTFARGGAATADNLRIMCRAHNMFLARQDYGRAFMETKLREKAARK